MIRLHLGAFSVWSLAVVGRLLSKRRKAYVSKVRARTARREPVKRRLRCDSYVDNTLRDFARRLALTAVWGKGHRAVSRLHGHPLPECITTRHARCHTCRRSGRSLLEE